jgi:predicted porin
VTTGGSFVGYGDNNRTTAAMRQEIRINFSGSTLLDNGITVGVLVGLNGENVQKSGSLDQIYNSYAYFNGTFGQIRIGETDSALVTNCVLDPGNVTWNFGVNSPWESYSNVGRAAGPVTTPATQGIGFTFGVSPIGSVGTCYGIEYQANKIMYFSPMIGGFSFAASFAPQGNSRFAGGGITPGTDVSSNPVDDVLSVYANYEHQFDGWKLTAGAGGEWSFSSLTAAGAPTNDKAAMYSAGLQVGFGKWTVGASGAYYKNYSHDGYAAPMTAMPPPSPSPATIPGW